MLVRDLLLLGSGRDHLFSKISASALVSDCKSPVWLLSELGRLARQARKSKNFTFDGSETGFAITLPRTGNL